MRPFAKKHHLELERMLRLREAGYTYKSLSIIYGVDHSSIYHHCIQHNIHPHVTKTFELWPFLPTLQVEIHPLLPRRNKTYAEYLQEQRFPNLP